MNFEPPIATHEGVVPEGNGPSYHPSILLKLYIYGYLDRIQSSRRLERKAGRNLEVIWLLRRHARPPAQMKGHRTEVREEPIV